jgi:coproporphyrinogen III oxidase-like Fe-S oxidoreductase
MNQIQRVSERILTGVMRQQINAQLNLAPLIQPVLPPPKSDRQYVLYIHVPFCESLCPYCSFNRFIFNEDRAKLYFQNLRRELKMISARGYQFASLYIGGGTPTILPRELAETIDEAHRLFAIGEVSCETNPNHLTPEILNMLKGRVDRLSVGVQSFNDGLLRQMSRFEKFGGGDEILARIQDSIGILPALNVDMIFNFPDQTEEILRQDIATIIQSGANQATFYPLMSAPSVENALLRTLGHIGTQREIDFYQIISDELGKVYQPMSAWTFSRLGGGMLDEYIVDYEEYVGAGSGAFSYLDGCLYVNTFSLNEYNQAITSNRHPLTGTRRFDKTARMRYRFMMELFDLHMDTCRFERDFGVPVELGLWKEMAFLAANGAFSGYHEGVLHIHPRGRYLLVVMMREFFAGVNRIRDQARLNLAPSERLMCVVNEKPVY